MRLEKLDKVQTLRILLCVYAEKYFSCVYDYDSSYSFTTPVHFVALTPSYSFTLTP